MDPAIETGFLQLKSTPSAKISYALDPGNGEEMKRFLIIFLSAIDTSKKYWMPMMAAFKRKRAKQRGWPPMLAYDRFGIPPSDKDPVDADKPPAAWHDVLATVRCLREIIEAVMKKTQFNTGKEEPNLILVGNSIGCAVSRLYASTYPGTVGGLLLMDSPPLISEKRGTIMPDTSSPDFNINDLPEGIDVETLDKSLETFLQSRFHHRIPNKEGLNWRDLVNVLPSDGPRLQSPNRQVGPFITVLRHDPQVFAGQLLKVCVVSD
jgi:pimeloyl-ACP methyl ester carboxylesterase